MQGFWIGPYPVVQEGPDLDYTHTEGTKHTSTSTWKEEWGQSLEVAIQRGFKEPTRERSIKIDSTTSYSMAVSTSDSIESYESDTFTWHFSGPARVWQWAWGADWSAGSGPGYGQSLTKTPLFYPTVANVKPCCIPQQCNFDDCQTCTDPATGKPGYNLCD